MVEVMTTAASGYRPSPIKRRRRTTAEIDTICDAIIAELSDVHPQSVRHVFYRLCGSPGVPKTESGYKVVQRQLLKLRQDRVIPWSWVSDGTRWRRHQASFDSPAEAVRWTAETYRRDLWRRTPVYVEVWC